VVLAAPGDRRDEDVKEIARIAAGWFDRYICRRDDSLRGRKPDEIPVMLRDALVEFGVPEEQIAVVPDEQEATAQALSEARAGDLVLIFGDAVTRTWEQISAFRPVEVERRSARRGSPGSNGAAATHPVAPALAPEAPPVRTFVRDVRGVRIAREVEGED
jgi:cyanophycin synthetase